MKENGKKFNICCCIASGVLEAAAFSVENLWAVSFFALIPFFLVLWKEKNTKGRLMLYVFSYGISYYTILMHWLFVLVPVFPVDMNMAVILIVIGILLIGTINSLLLAIPICLFSYIRQNRAWDIVTLSFLYIFGEWMQENLLPVAFPFVRLGIAVTPFTAFLQSASLFGGLFISLLVLFVNGIAAYLLNKRKELKKGKRLSTDTCILIVLIIILSINTIGGYIRLFVYNDEKAGQEILLVQGNHSGLMKWNITPQEILNDYIDLTLQNMTKETKIIIWPETAIPIYLQEQKEIKDRLVRICRENNTILLLGAFKRENIKGETKEFNALFKVTGTGIDKDAYYKQILVPFGEYLPFEKVISKFLPELTDSLKEQLSISSGTKSNSFYTPYGKIGGIICYESIFSSIAKNAVKEGAEIFTVASNDSWFADSPALYEHHAHSIMRAVEYNRYLLRASNTAITSVIAPTGRVIAKAQPFTKTTLRAKAEFIRRDTLYSKIGNVIIILGFFICFVLAIKK